MLLADCNGQAQMIESRRELRPPKIQSVDRVDQALAEAMRALDRDLSDEAERIVLSVLKFAPQHHRARYVLGCALLKQGRTEQAVAQLETAARGSPDSQIETMLGIALRQAGQLPEALARLRRATKRRPPYAPAWYQLGTLLVAMDRDEAAIEAFRGGLEIAPMMPELWIQLGYALLWRKHCEKAKVAFARALEIAPSSAEALVGIGKTHRDIAEVEPAAEYFRRAVVVRPEDPGIWLELGLALQELGQSDAARDALRRAARGQRKRYLHALNSLVASGHGRFWMRPSAAAQFFQVEA